MAPNSRQKFVNWRGEFYALGLGSRTSYDRQALYRFDGERWRQLEGVLPPGAELIVASSNCLYMAGAFTNVGQVTAHNVAAWDGAKWEAVAGPGYSPGPVQCAAMAADGRLYVAGQFPTPGRTGEDFVLAWNGRDWVAPAGGLAMSGAQVNDLVTTTKGELYLAVEFNGTGPARHELVRFDGLRWRRHPSSAAIKALAAAPDGTVYGIGRFLDAAPGTPRGAGRWDGERWRSLGQGLWHPQTNTLCETTALAFWRNSLVVGGSFRKAGDVDANFIAGWNGTNWFPLGSGLGAGGLAHADTFSARGPVFFETTYPQVLIPTEQALVVFGSFTQAGDAGVHGAARWDGRMWRPFAHRPHAAVSGRIEALATDGQSVIAAGHFTAAGRAAANGLARWENGEWRDFGHQVPRGNFNRLASAAGRVWIGSVPTDSSERSILEWDGQRLRELPKLAYSPFPSMVSDGSTLFIGDQTLRSWNGTQVTPLASLPRGSFIGIRAMALRSDNEVYAAFLPNGSAGSLVQLWNGTSWQTLADGPEGLSANALCMTPAGLYAAGEFQWSRPLTWKESVQSTAGSQANPRAVAGIVRLNNVGLWDGTQWQPLGTGVQTAGQFPMNQAFVSALAFTNGVLYVGGRFTQAGGIPARNIAAWNGQRWFALGDGVGGSPGQTGGEVNALVIHGDHLYVGGEFGEAGGESAANFARWRLQ